MNTRETRTSDLVGGAFYYARGLRFKGMEFRTSPEGRSADGINLLFGSGPELDAITNQYYNGKAAVTEEELLAFVATLHRWLKAHRQEMRREDTSRLSTRDGGDATGGGA